MGVACEKQQGELSRSWPRRCLYSYCCLCGNLSIGTSVVSSSANYRPEIDGLRAVSILAVLLFHAGLGCSGGFIGVDVFFVISGFLITGQIVKDLNVDRFSFATFWERRVRRILPASLFVTGVTLLFGWFVFTPPELKHLAKCAIAHLSFLSNVYFPNRDRGILPSRQICGPCCTCGHSRSRSSFMFYSRSFFFC